MKSEAPLQYPVFAPGTRYRRDEIRQQHQIVYPEGVLILNESAAAVVRLCDGRSTLQLISALREQIGDVDPCSDVHELLDRLAKKGLLRDGAS